LALAAVLVEDIKAKLDEFLRFVESEEGTPNPDVITQTFGRFHWAAFKVFGILSAYAHFDPTAVNDLAELAERCERPDLTRKYASILQRLTRSAIWYGRYPSPISPSGMNVLSS